MRHRAFGTSTRPWAVERALGGVMEALVVYLFLAGFERFAKYLANRPKPGITAHLSACVLAGVSIHRLRTLFNRCSRNSDDSAKEASHLLP